MQSYAHFYSKTNIIVSLTGAQSKINLEWEVAFLTHICERGVVPNV